jgi:hypothetical protein
MNLKNDSKEKLMNKLYKEIKKEIIFKLIGKVCFKLFDMNNIIHSTFSHNSMKYNKNLVPIINCSSDVSFKFRIARA